MGGLSRRRICGRRPRGLQRGAQGFILLDVLAALAIALVGLALFLGSLSTLGRLTIRQAEHARSVIEQRNLDAIDRATSFQGK